MKLNVVLILCAVLVAGCNSKPPTESECQTVADKEIEYAVGHALQENKAMKRVEGSSSKNLYGKLSVLTPRITLWLARGLIFAWGMALAGCDNVSLQWSEQARLQDGQMVVVQRTAQGKTYSELGGPGGWRGPVEMSVSVTETPGNVKLPPVWHDAYVPVLLDYDASSKSWSMLASFYYCETWYGLGRPIPPYIEYQSIHGSPWKRVPLEERFIDRETNLLTGPRTDGEPSLMMIADKEFRQRSSERTFQRIQRKWGREEGNFCDLN